MDNLCHKSHAQVMAVEKYRYTSIKLRKKCRKYSLNYFSAQFGRRTFRRTFIQSKGTLINKKAPQIRRWKQYSPFKKTNKQYCGSEFVHPGYRIRVKKHRIRIHSKEFIPDHRAPDPGSTKNLGIFKPKNMKYDTGCLSRVTGSRITDPDPQQWK